MNYANAAGIRREWDEGFIQKTPRFIDRLCAPLTISWQMTRDCNLACLHCCTDSAPGKALPGELTTRESLGLVEQFGKMGVPYVILCGGEPLLRPDFFDIAQAVAGAGCGFKVETNGHLVSEEAADRLAVLNPRSVQLSLDGAGPAAYERMRIHGSFESAIKAGRRLTKRGVALEITFAPARFSITEASQVIDLAASLGAFRFNTGRLMPVGTAAKTWDAIEPSESQYQEFIRILSQKHDQYKGSMEILFEPMDLGAEIRSTRYDPPATFLILPDGRVKLTGGLPFICANLREQTLAQAWDSFKTGWLLPEVAQYIDRVESDLSVLRESNRWLELSIMGSQAPVSQ